MVKAADRSPVPCAIVPLRYWLKRKRSFGTSGQALRSFLSSVTCSLADDQDVREAKLKAW